jgi:hypothetical protein
MTLISWVRGPTGTSRVGKIAAEACFASRFIPAETCERVGVDSAILSWFGGLSMLAFAKRLASISFAIRRLS